MNLKYEESGSISKDEFSRIIALGHKDSMCQAIVDVVHSISDYDWLLKEFVSLLTHHHVEVRKVSVTCIGHLARLNKNANKKQLLDILQPLLLDKEVFGNAEEAISDVNIFIQ